MDGFGGFIRVDLPLEQKDLVISKQTKSSDLQNFTIL